MDSSKVRRTWIDQWLWRGLHKVTKDLVPSRVKPILGGLDIYYAYLPNNYSSPYMFLCLFIISVSITPPFGDGSCPISIIWYYDSRKSQYTDSCHRRKPIMLNHIDIYPHIYWSRVGHVTQTEAIRVLICNFNFISVGKPLVWFAERGWCKPITGYGHSYHLPHKLSPIAIRDKKERER